MDRCRSRNGRLIVFEGPDGVGKSTIAAAVAAYLESCGEPCVQLAFPGREPGTLGQVVYEIHHDPGRFDIVEMSATSRQTLHIAAHLDAIERRIVPTLLAGVHVVLDRFWWSTWVHGVVGGMDRRVLRRLIDVERAQWGPISPSVVVLLRRETPLKPVHDINNWNALRQEYDWLAERERASDAVAMVENVGSLDNTVAAVVRDIQRRLVQTAGLVKESRAEPDIQLSLELGSPPTTRFLGVSIMPSRLAPAVPTAIYDTYWRFAAERQEIFFRRLEKRPPPWTADPILASHKFTNAYRASDRVSQYLIRRVIYREDLPSSEDEVFFRTILFKLFNKVETWELLEKNLGALTYEDYEFDRYDGTLSRAMAAGARIYSAAYIMPPGGRSFGEVSKHRNHLRLLERMMADGLPERFANAGSMQRAFELLRAYPTIGDFLAYQFATDVNYSWLTDFTEMEFVMPGPGALDGIRKCFSDLGGLNEPELIRLVADRQQEEFARLGLQFRTLWSRPLQLIDCQNLFCEVDKYARVAHPEIVGRTGRKRIKQRFAPNNRPIHYWYPPKWGVNSDAERSQNLSPL